MATSSASLTGALGTDGANGMEKDGQQTEVAGLKRKLVLTLERVSQLEAALAASKAEFTSAKQTFDELRANNMAVLESSSKQIGELRTAYKKERQHNLLYEKILASKQAELEALQEKYKALATSMAGVVHTNMAVAQRDREVQALRSDGNCSSCHGDSGTSGVDQAVAVAGVAPKSAIAPKDVNIVSVKARLQAEIELNEKLRQEIAASNEAIAQLRAARTNATQRDLIRAPIPVSSQLHSAAQASKAEGFDLDQEMRRLRLEVRALRRDAHRSRRAEMLLAGVNVFEIVVDWTQSLFQQKLVVRLVKRGLRLSRDRERIIISTSPSEGSLLGDSRAHVHKLTIEYGTSHPRMQILHAAVSLPPPPPWLCFSLVFENGSAQHFLTETDAMALGVVLALREQRALRRKELGLAGGSAHLGACPDEATEENGAVLLTSPDAVDVVV
eukprot:scaffold122857_cov30-Tisochrysis_lutea.AAC.2